MTQSPRTEPPPVAAVIVLAAGAGTRMKSALPKVLHPLAGRPLLWHALAAAASLAPTNLVAVLGHGREQVADALRVMTDLPPVIIAVQDEQLGTAHAVACALAVTGSLSGTVVVTCGDVPLLRGDTLRHLIAAHRAAGNAVTVLTANPADATGYGRVIRDASGQVDRIVEHRDATAAELAIGEINSGVYAFDGEMLAAALPRVAAANAQGERYLPDVVRLARLDGRRVGAVTATDAGETEGVNDRVQLAAMARELNGRLVRQAQLAGVTVLDPATTWLHADVTIGADSVLLPGTSLEAGTTVGRRCTIGPATTLSGCVVADDVTVVRSHCLDARIGAAAEVGPFSFLRPGAELGAQSKAGAFVEIKNSTIGPDSKVPHLSYVGDATVGRGVNLGAGSITANYDGVRKHRTLIGDHVFVGSDSTLVAPVEIAAGAYIAAGSTITEPVAAGDLGIARARQAALAGWVLRRRSGTATAAAAVQAGAAALEPTGSTDPRAAPGEDPPA